MPAISTTCCGKPTVTTTTTNSTASLCGVRWRGWRWRSWIGRMNGKSIGQLLGDVRRKEIAVYVASGRRDTTPPQEIEYLQSLVEMSKAKALKFRLGGRMSKNADAMPGRTETLIPLVRKTFGDAFDLHGDSNSSYDPAHAIPVGRLLEEYRYVYYEEPCEFD